MDRMNPLDAEFLYMEDGTAHMHIASCALFEGPAPDYDRLVDRIRVKLPLVPRYRQRVQFLPLDLRRPLWVDDPHFNLEYHVRHTALAPPGGKAELCRLMGRLMSQELDRARPLWEAWVVEGLADGQWAVISKVHHCMVDGVAGADLMAVVLDLEREPPSVAVEDWEPEPQPSALRLAVDGAVNIVARPAEQIRGVVGSLLSPRRVLARGRTIASGLWGYGSALRPTPPTTLDGTIGPHRRWTYAGGTLDEIRKIRQALGGTVNDVVLAAVTSGFRDLIVARGEDPERVSLRTLVPVSVRQETDHGVYDNQVSAIFLDLPVHIADPRERLAAVHAEMDRLKQSHEAEAGQALTHLAGAVPPAFMGQGTRLVSRLLARVPQRTMNTVTTNVPGPQFPLHFAVTGDYDTAPDIEILAGGIAGALETRLGLAGPRRSRRKEARRHAQESHEWDGVAPARRGGSSMLTGGSQSAPAAHVSRKSP